MVTANRIPVPLPIAPEKLWIIPLKNTKNWLTQKVGRNGKCPNAKSAECGRCWNISVQFVNHWLFPMSAHNHLLFFQLFGHIFCRWAAHIDPCFWEECTGAKHKNDVNEAMDWIFQDVGQWFGRRQIIANSTWINLF